MTGSVRRLDIGRGFVRARECPDCFHTKCGEDCVCNCDAAHAEAEAAHLRAQVEELQSLTTWRPMAEAPRDGNSFLAYWGSLALGRFGPVHFDGSRFVCQGSPGLPESRLLGWLPIPPSAKGGDS